MKSSQERYPEHEKLKAVKVRAQAVGEFLEWLSDTKGISLAVQHEHSLSCHGSRGIACGYHSGELTPAFASTRRLLAEFFEIDEERLEAEKREMLAEIRGEGP